MKTIFDKLFGWIGVMVAVVVCAGNFLTLIGAVLMFCSCSNDEQPAAQTEIHEPAPTPAIEATPAPPQRSLPEVRYAKDATFERGISRKFFLYQYDPALDQRVDIQYTLGSTLEQWANSVLRNKDGFILNPNENPLKTVMGHWLLVRMLNTNRLYHEVLGEDWLVQIWKDNDMKQIWDIVNKYAPVAKTLFSWIPEKFLAELWWAAHPGADVDRAYRETGSGLCVDIPCPDAPKATLAICQDDESKQKNWSKCSFLDRVGYAKAFFYRMKLRGGGELLRGKFFLWLIADRIMGHNWQQARAELKRNLATTAMPTKDRMLAELERPNGTFVKEIAAAATNKGIGNY